MKKYAITNSFVLFLGIILTLCLNTTFAQSCSAGGGDEFFISFGENINSYVNGGSCSSTSWSFISGPLGPRGPRFPSITDNGDDDDVDFPNTGGGPDQEYVFEYTVTDGAIVDSAQYTFWVLIDDRATEERTIYTCPGETIADQNELFNAFTLDKIRDITNSWYPDQNLPESDPNYDDPFFYQDNVTPATFPTGAGNYLFFGNSLNKLKVSVEEISCSNENIQFSFANAQNTNDGTNDFFEVDVMVKTTGNSFKLGSGQLFFNYNSLAFGEYISAFNNIEITFPFSEGYIAGQPIDSDPNTAMYSDFRVFDNTQDSVDSWFSWTFNQNSSGSNIAANNVTSTASKLCHIKIKYADVHLDPMLSFELENFKNKFTTACGWDSNGDSSNCNLEARLLLTDADTFSNSEFENLEGISLYPNPSKDILFVEGNISELNTIEIYSITGKQVMTLNHNLESINISTLQAGMYFVKLSSENTSKTIKIIKA